MSPEYTVDGVFSVKSDVFSFGVLVLEIVSGKKNRGFIHADHHHNLLGHVSSPFRYIPLYKHVHIYIHKYGFEFFRHGYCIKKVGHWN